MHELAEDTVPKIDVKSFEIGSFKPQEPRGRAGTTLQNASGMKTGIGVGSRIGGGLKQPTLMKPPSQ